MEKKLSRNDLLLSRRLSSIILTFFLFSGMAGLIYEILWTRMLVKIIGAAPFAISIILTIFMGGLGLGSYLASRYIDRIQPLSKLIKIYGLLEIIIGCYALALPILLVFLRPLQALLYNHLYNHFLPYHLLTFLICAILLCVPVLCMGATLPLLCRFYVSRLSHLGTHTGRLYGLNTIGAAAGALICGFWLIQKLGMWGTLFLAVFINLIIGFACLWLFSQVKKQPEKFLSNRMENQTKEIPDANGTQPDMISPQVLQSALFIFAISGFCAMAYEVFWTKLLGLLIGPTTYSFSIVLVTFITGLAVGSMIFGRLADRVQNPMKLLLCTQIIAALLVLGISQFLGNSQLFFSKLIYLLKDNFPLLNLSKAVTLFFLMLAPTLLLGATFPLVGKIYTRTVTKIGHSIGKAYAINTLGAVLGAFSAGFLFSPLVGKESGLSLVIGLQLLSSIGIAIFLFAIKNKSFKTLTPLISMAIIGLSLCLFFPRWNHRLLASGKYYRMGYLETAVRRSGWMQALFKGTDILNEYESGELLYYGEGIGGFTSVIKTFNPLGDIELSMANSGKMDASSRGDMKTQTLLAHFPLLFHENPKNIMVLGLASGVTAGEVLCYPIEKLDILEINQQVITASDFFRQWNNEVLDQPQANLILQDARAHLQLTQASYDAIISEPSNPWMAGLATLFTQDFFQLVEKRLNQNGIFVQWLHSYNMDWSTFALVGRTFVKVFPNSLLISTGPFPYSRDYLLVGLKGQSKISLDVARRNFPFAQTSKNMTLANPALIYRLIVNEDLGRLFGDGPVNTDNFPSLEFAAPKLMFLTDPEIRRQLQAGKELRPERVRIASALTANIESQIDFAAYALSLYAPFPNMVELSQATPEQRNRFQSLLETYCTRNVVDYSMIGDEELASSCRRVQIAIINQTIADNPDKAEAYFYLANLYFGENMLNEAVLNYTQSLDLRADNAYAHNNLGYALMLQGENIQASVHFREAIRINPGFAEAHRNLGLAMANTGDLNKAAQEFRIAIQLLPDNPALHNDLGVILSRLENWDEAIFHFKEALRIQPDYSEAQRNLEIALGRK